MRYLTFAKDKGLKLLDEIRYALKPEAERAGRKELGLKALTPDRGEMEPNESHLANWVLARFFSMPRAERDRFIREGKRVTDDHLAADRHYAIAEDWGFAGGPAAAGEADAIDSLGPPGADVSPAGPRRKRGAGGR
jgi:hypothetical protein